MKDAERVRNVLFGEDLDIEDTWPGGKYDTIEKLEALSVERHGFRVRVCGNEKIVFYERPDRGAAAVVDGSQYRGEFITAEDFGCSLHEPL